MVTNIRKYWEHGQKDLTLNTIAYLLATLRGGESITIKSKEGNTGIIYVGSDRLVSSTTGYELGKDETMTFTMPIDFGATSFIEIWGKAATAGDDVTWFKLIDLYPHTAAVPTVPAAQ